MGKRGPLGIVKPEEFEERTALTFSKRSGTTLKVDAAYREYYFLRDDANAARLHAALREYVSAHGGYWARCDRDKVSGGLLEYLYKHTAPRAPAAVAPGSAADLDRRAQRRIEEEEIPYSRYGVLYLLGNIDIDMNLINLGLEGVSVVGGAVGMGLSTDMNRLHDKVNGSSKAVGLAVNGKDIGAQTVVKGGALVVKLAPRVPALAAELSTSMSQETKRKIKDATYTTLAVSPRALPPRPAARFDPNAPINRHVPRPVAPGTSFPTTVSTLMVTAEKLTDAYNHGKWYGRAATGAALVASPVVLAGALLVDAGRALWKAIRDAVMSMKDLVLKKLVTPIGMSGQGATIASIAKGIGLVLIDILMKEAAPLVGAIKDLAGGLAKTIGAVKTRMESYLDRKKIRVVEGHPEEIANSIESCMNQGMFMGLLDILKGAGKAAVQATLPGLGQLVSAIMTGIEWLVKFISRLVENYCVKKFLGIARGYYEIERKRAIRETHTVQDIGGGMTARTTRAAGVRLKPNLAPGGIITDTKKFTEFFKLGCEASPVIPMLTLNSGVCGSLMTLARMFDDTGQMIKAAEHGAKKKEEFDIAGRYFKRLKEYGAAYLKACGFKFRAIKPGDDMINGLLTHAVNHHQAKWTATGALATFLTAA